MTGKPINDAQIAILKDYQVAATNKLVSLTKKLIDLEAKLLNIEKEIASLEKSFGSYRGLHGLGIRP